MKVLGFGVVMVASASAEPICAPEIVDQAASDGFLNYVLLNCAKNASSKNMLGEDYLGSSACLTQFVVTQQASGNTTNAIPLAGSCRQTYQAFVLAIESVASNAVFTSCVYDSTTGLPIMSLACGQTLAPAMLTFQQSNSVSITGSVGQCRSELVRARSIGAENKLMDEIVSVGSVVSPSLPVSLTSSADGLCDVCYDWFLNDVSFGLKGDGSSFLGYADLLADCAADAYSDNCMHSTTVEDARAKFLTCAGEDVLFYGPLCTADQVTEIQHLIPTPYVTLTTCAMSIAKPAYCATLPSYMNQIEQDSDSHCLSCYSEYSSAIATLSSSSDFASICSDVWADKCMSRVGSALINFATCTGFHMENVIDDLATVAPATEEPATTNTPTTIPSVAPTTAKSAALATSASVTLLAPLYAMMH